MGGVPKRKETITLTDETDSVKVEIWGEICDKLNSKPGKIIALKYCVGTNKGLLSASKHPPDAHLDVQHQRFWDLKLWSQKTA